ncbi:MAG: BMP family ABC transporter substrate-binding protein [Chthonomonas sp.]|nr:BMP family ABC transporter substrate-binding protein [Chthonomonas sp.]
MKKTTLFVALFAGLLLGGCNSTPTEGKTDTPATTGGTNDAKKLKIGVVFDSGGRGDKSFNDSAWAGIERAQKELGIEAFPIETKNEKDYETNQGALAEKGCDLVIAIGLNQETALKKVAAAFPDQKFAIVDGTVDAKNVRCLKFKEEEGSFLVGYLAGMMTKTNKIGFVGGMKIPLIAKFMYGYMAGAKTANKAVEILPEKFTDNWDDSQKGKAAAALLFGQGADIVYHAAGRAGLGVITAAKESGHFAIGVDSNQDDIAPGSVLTSMIKRVDEAVFSTISDVKNGAYSPGEKIYDLKVNGVGLSPLDHTKSVIGDANLAKIEEIKKKIIAGEIKVPAVEADYTAYISTIK